MDTTAEMDRDAKPQTLAEAFRQVCLLDAPLNERLAAYAARLRELNFPFAEAYDDLVARLIAGDIGASAPVVGEPMPRFVLPARGGTLMALEDVLERGPAVISFNRGHWCPFCRIELRSIAAQHAEIAALGAEVVSIMPDRQQFLWGTYEETGEHLIILSDIDNAYALSLGLVLWLGDRLQELMRGLSLHLETFHGADGWFVPLPATFVVGRDGRVAGRHVDPDFRKRMEVEEILEILQSLR